MLFLMKKSREISVMAITAESTFGAGEKYCFETLKAIFGRPKIWTERASRFVFGGRLTILWATSFWTIKVISLGGYFEVKNKRRKREVM